MEEAWSCTQTGEKLLLSGPCVYFSRPGGAVSGPRDTGRRVLLAFLTPRVSAAGGDNVSPFSSCASVHRGGGSDGPAGGQCPSIGAHGLKAQSSCAPHARRQGMGS